VNTELKILIDDGTIGGIREIGEILVRNQATKFLGYFNRGPKPILDDEGWLHTSDMGFIDESNEINIIGQRTFIIKNIFNEIFPCEIEDIIEMIPGVKFVCVVGTPDPTEVEVATALVVKDAGSHLNEEIIVESTSNLPTFKQLRGGVFFVESLPTNGSGKIQRKEAKEIATKLKIERLSRS
jgi:acyl-CoA synthetase (AMP-forming)/AMP-acid ligase II